MEIQNYIFKKLQVCHLHNPKLVEFLACMVKPIMAYMAKGYG